MNILKVEGTQNFFRDSDIQIMVDALNIPGGLSWRARVHVLAGLVYTLLAAEKRTSDKDRMAHWMQLPVLLSEYKNNPSRQGLIRDYLKTLPGFKCSQDEISPSNIMIQNHAYLQAFLYDIMESDVWNQLLEKRMLTERHKFILEKCAVVGAL